jgi:Na+/H+-dicarboxylate symporter
MVLTTVGVPSSGIALIMGIGRILEISRTSITSAATPVVAVTAEWTKAHGVATANSGHGADPERPPANHTV